MLPARDLILHLAETLPPHELNLWAAAMEAASFLGGGHDDESAECAEADLATALDRLRQGYGVAAKSKTKFYVATLARCVIVEAASEEQAREQGQQEIARRFPRSGPAQIRVVRPATPDEIELHLCWSC